MRITFLILVLGLFYECSAQRNPGNNSYLTRSEIIAARAAPGANTDITSMILDQSGLRVKGGNSNHLTLKVNETLTNNRILNLVTNDVDRTISLSGNLTVSSAATIAGTNTGDQTFLGLAPTVTGNGGKFLRVNAGATDYELVTLSGGGDALVANPLSQFAATTSLQLAGNITNETGSDGLVFQNSPTFTGTPLAPTAALNTNNTQIATTAYVDGKIFTAKLGSDHAMTSTTGSEVSCGATGLVSGTYVFTYYVIAQSATTTVSPMFGINFTGTAAVRKMKVRTTTTGTTAITGIADDVGAASGQIEESVSVTAFTTTAPNLGFTGVATQNVDILYIIEGILIVTATGDLELWHSSETNTSTTVKAGTSLILTRTN
jgi:hypothetical protein